MTSLIFTLLLWAVAAAAVATALVMGSDGTASAKWHSTDVAEAYECPKPCNRFQIVWTGDVSLNRNFKEYKKVKKRGLDNPFVNLRQLLQADYVVGNSEAPITSSNAGVNKSSFADPKGPQNAKLQPHWTSRMEPAAAQIFHSVGFNAMGLGNNHAWDYGEDGLHDSRMHLQKAGIKTFGSGDSVTKAEEPLLIDTPFGKVGVVNLVSQGSQVQKWLHNAGKSSPGVVWQTEHSIKRGAKLARRRGAKWIVAFTHWGLNYRNVSKPQIRDANLFAESGYDLVVGGHSHTAQRIERIGKTLIMYSLGNFVFTRPGRYRKSIPGREYSLGYGLVARTFLGPQGFEGVELTCINVDNKIINWRPRVCTPNERTELFSSLGGIRPSHMVSDERGDRARRRRRSAMLPNGP